MTFYFLHPFVHNLEEAERYIKVPIPKHVEWDSKQPELLFVSEWIYYKRRIFKEFKRLWPKAKLRVFYAGEAIEPDFNLFDYAIGFDDCLEYGDRFIRLPSPLDFFPNFIKNKGNNILSKDDARRELDRKKAFCSFLYSNPNAHPMRDRLFYEISKYKQVDSLGKHLNNVAKQGTGYVGHAAEGIDLKAQYKFSIASENACYSGYTSEKILTSLAAHTVPIYWGNPRIIDDINPKAFINVCDFSSFDDLRKYIEYVDTNDDVWIQMISEPWMTLEQQSRHALRTDIYHKRVQVLFEGNIGEKMRIPHGTHEEFYRTHYFYDVYPLQLNSLNFTKYINKVFNKLLCLQSETPISP